jgi:sorting nexin-8
MSGIFDSSHNPPRRSIFDDDGADDDHHPTETDPFLSHSKTSTIDSHPAPSASQNIARLPSPTTLQQDHFATSSSSGAGPPSYTTPPRNATSRSSYESPANDPWSSTPRTNGIVPVAVPNFPRHVNALPSAGILGGGEIASYLLDADHIDIQKSDEKEGIMGFKHVNYTVNSARRGTQVVRRYSDFAWYEFPKSSVDLGYLMLLSRDIHSDRSP